MRDANFVVVAHRHFPLAGDELVSYLNAERVANVLFIAHSFSDAPDRCSTLYWYQQGKLVRSRRSRGFDYLPEPLVYAKELLFTWLWILRSGVRWDRIVCLDGLCSLFGIPLKMTGRVAKVAYWSIDFVPNDRFEVWWKNSLYRMVNKYAGLHADEMWDLSPAMVSAKSKFAGLKPADYRSHRIVPIGVWTERIPRYRFDESERHTLVFMGHLLEKQGVQLVIRAIPEIVRHIPAFMFKIIGSGGFESPLRQLVTSLNLNRHVLFLGGMYDHIEMEQAIARSGAAIAPYVRALDKWTQFGADPGKIKTYLGCGLPILATDVSWIATELERRGCGSIIREDPSDIAQRVVQVLTDTKMNDRCRKNSASFAAEWDWRRIFEAIDL